MSNHLLDFEVLALQIRTLHHLFEGLDEQMVQLATTGYALSDEQAEMLYTKILTHMEFGSHVSTGVAATLSGLVRGPMSTIDIQDT
jgi:hypothetical protein